MLKWRQKAAATVLSLYIGLGPAALRFEYRTRRSEHPVSSAEFLASEALSPRVTSVRKYVGREGAVKTLKLIRINAQEHRHPLWQKLARLRRRITVGPDFVSRFEQKTFIAGGVDVLEAIFKGTFENEMLDRLPEDALRPTLPPKKTYSLSETARITGISKHILEPAFQSGRLPSTHKIFPASPAPHYVYTLPHVVVEALYDLISLDEAATLLGLNTDILHHWFSKNPVETERWGLIQLTKGGHHPFFVSRFRISDLVRRFYRRISRNQALIVLQKHGIRTYEGALTRWLKDVRLELEPKDAAFLFGRKKQLEDRHRRIDLLDFARLAQAMRLRQTIQDTWETVQTLARRAGPSATRISFKISAGVIRAARIHGRDGGFALYIDPQESNRIVRMGQALRNPKLNLEAYGIRIKISASGGEWRPERLISTAQRLQSSLNAAMPTELETIFSMVAWYAATDSRFRQTLQSYFSSCEWFEKSAAERTRTLERLLPLMMLLPDSFHSFRRAIAGRLRDDLLETLDTEYKRAFRSLSRLSSLSSYGFVIRIFKEMEIEGALVILASDPEAGMGIVESMAHMGLSGVENGATKAVVRFDQDTRRIDTSALTTIVSAVRMKRIISFFRLASKNKPLHISPFMALAAA